MNVLLVFLVVFPRYLCGKSLLITENRLPLVVEEGKSVFLSQAHIPIDPKLQSADLCQVEVDDIQPLSSFVGFLKPKKFPCFFKPNTVLYQHEGSTLKSSDTIHLNIYFFRKQYSTTQSLNISVSIISPVKPSRVNLKSHLSVSSWKGISQAISSKLLTIQYNPEREFCRLRHYNNEVMLSNLYPWLAFRLWPITGVLITFNKSKIYDINMECQQALIMGFRFMHRKSRSSQLDFLPIIIEISRLENDEIIDVTYLHIPIRISSKTPNGILDNKLPPPNVKAFRPIILKNSGGTLSILPSDCLELSNQDKERGPLIVQIVSMDGSFVSSFRNLRDPSKSIWSFTFNDLTSGRIAFQLQSYSEDVKKIFRLDIIVMDSYFVKSEVVILKIINILENKDLPFQVFTTPFYTYTSSNRPLRSNNIQIVGQIDLNLVKFKIINQNNGTGLLYKYPSTLLVNKQQANNPYFGPNDTKKDLIFYKHDGSLSESDSIIIEVSIDRFRFVNIKLPIYIVRVYNRTKGSLMESYQEFVTLQGGLLKINIWKNLNKKYYFYSILRDSVDIIFETVSPLLNGNLVKLLPGQNETVFSIRSTSIRLQDFLDGLMYYHNKQKYESSQDILELKQQGRFGDETFKLVFHIHYRVRNFLVPRMDSNIIFTISETNQYQKLSYLNLNFVNYFLPVENVTYEIVQYPRYEDTNETVDAGRLISLKSIQNDILVGDTALTTKITNYRSAHIASVTYFTQKQIIDSDIVYVPPLDDVGQNDRKVTFTYSVKDTDGFEIRNILFPILVKAVNNQPPFLQSYNIVVARDEEVFLTSKNLVIQDEDTNIKDIFVEFVNLPSHGVLFDKTFQIQRVGYKFKAKKLLKETLKYKHNGHNVNKDSFNIRLFDGVQTSEIYNILINVTKRVIQNSDWNLYINNSVLVRENSSVTLHQSIFQNVLKRFNLKQFPNPLFILVAMPTKGNIYNKMVAVSTFNFNEIKKGQITYNHFPAEIGSKSQFDFTKVWILQSGETFNLNFTILPVNSQSPMLYSQSSLQVYESGSIIINYFAISFKDLDSNENDIVVQIITPPRWGNIYLKGSSIPIQMFSIKDIKLGKIIYNNSLSGNGFENTQDVFTVRGTDGKYFSAPLEVQINIHSINDEPPNLVLKDFNIAVGETKILDENILQISDADIPRDDIQITVTRFPQYGNLSLKYKHGEMRTITKSSAPLTLQLLSFVHFAFIQTNSTINLQNSKFPIKDRFELKVTDGKFTVRKSAKVNITGFNKVSPVILSSIISLHQVDEKVIPSSDLSVSDPDTLPEDIVFTILKIPEKGGLFFGTKRLIRSQTFTQKDIINNKLKYKYLGPSVTYTDDHFIVKLFDGTFEVGWKQVHIFLTQPIQIQKMSIKISPLKVQIGRKFVLDKALFVIKNPVSDVINSLVFTIKNKLTCGAFYFYQNLEYPIFKFTFEDIKERRILLFISDCVEVVKFITIPVSIFSHKNFEQETFINIEILPRLTAVPVLKRNETLTLLTGSNVRLTKDLLMSTDEDSPSDKLMYKFVNNNQTDFEILVNKMLENNFTQFDINAEKVEIRISDTVNVNHTELSLLLTDGDNEGYIFNGFYLVSGLIVIPITFFNWQLEDLILLRYSVPVQMKFVDGYSGFQWTYDNLLVSRADAQIAVSRDLHAGFFYNIETKQSVSSFNQVSINRGKIFYLIHKEKGSKVYKELIQFKIYYQSFRISSEILELNWSIIEFDKIKYKLCPQRGLLLIDVLRIGNISYESQASVGFVSIEAVINQDFRLMSQRQLIFAPGENKTTVSIKILMTGSVVKENRFQIMLNFPKQAVFGQKSTSTISIKNRKSCGNKEYFLAEKSRKFPPKIDLKSNRNINQDAEYSFDDATSENNEYQDLPSSEELETQYKSFLDREYTKVKCTKDWVLFSQRCYRPFKAKLSWHNANKHCLKENSFLVSVTSHSQQLWLTKLFPKPKSFWIGLHRVQGGLNEWKYVNNEAYIYANWDSKFPTARNGKLRDCVLVTKKNRWKNRPCQNRKNSFICMKNPEVSS